MYLKLNDEQLINLETVTEVGVSHNDCYIRTNSNTYNIYSGENNEDAISIMEAFIKVNQIQTMDISTIIDEVFPPEVKSITAIPMTVNKNDTVTITIDLDKPVQSIADLKLTVDGRMSVKQTMTLDKSKVQATATYTAITTGVSNISAKTNKGKVLKTISVTINELPEVQSDIEFGKRALKN